MSKENKKRLDILYRKHNEWLRQVAWNISHDKDMVDDLVGELYLYLAEKGNKKIWYLDSFNLGYCKSFLQSRFINKIKSQNKMTEFDATIETPEVPYNTQFDERLDRVYEEIKELLKSKRIEKDWVSAKIAELYYFGNDFTIDSLAKHLGCSKSTVFLHIKKMRLEINEKIENPFDKEDNEEE